MKVKAAIAKAGLQLNIKKTKVMPPRELQYFTADEEMEIVQGCPQEIRKRLKLRRTAMNELEKCKDVLLATRSK